MMLCRVENKEKEIEVEADIEAKVEVFQEVEVAKVTREKLLTEVKNREIDQEVMIEVHVEAQIGVETIVQEDLLVVTTTQIEEIEDLHRERETKNEMIARYAMIFPHLA